MSLDTLLDIGQILRSAPDGLKHHRYIKAAPKPSEKSPPIKYLNIPVTKDFEVLLDEYSLIEDQNVINANLFYYLNFKTGDADSTKKYIFGDICQNIIKASEETNFKLGDPTVKAKGFQINSFYRGKEEAKFFDNKDSGIAAFRNSFEKQINKIENLLKTEPNIFLHFDFNGKHWYELQKEWQLINDLQMSYFASFNEDIQKYVLGAYLHRTIRQNDHRAKTFKSLDEILDLMYAIDYSKRSQITEREIKIIVLPNIKTRDVTARELEKFFKKDEEQIDNIDSSNPLLQTPEKSKKGKPQKQNIDRLLAVTESIGNHKNFDVFDFIFTKQGGATSPDYDLIEISGIQKSFLSSVAERIKNVKDELHKQFRKEFPLIENMPNLQVFWAFNNILGDVTKDKKKYRNHLLKVLPKIYTASYCNDDLLLPCFIQQIETRIRDGTENHNYNFLKYEYYFLVGLRNPPEEPFIVNNGEIKKMQQSKSYQIGLKLGELAKPIRKQIASFEKNYVGLLSRRIAELKDLIKFSAFINEKLCIHGVAYKDLQNNFLELTEELKELKESEYNKHECAFGFFESYFKYNQKENPENTKQITEGE